MGCLVNIRRQPASRPKANIVTTRLESMAPQGHGWWPWDTKPLVHLHGSVPNTWVIKQPIRFMNHKLLTQTMLLAYWVMNVVVLANYGHNLLTQIPEQSLTTSNNTRNQSYNSSKINHHVLSAIVIFQNILEIPSYNS